MKLGFAFAAIAAATLAMPSLASAETTVIKKVVHRDGPRAEMRHHHHDRGFHRGHAKKVVIIKHRGHHH